MDAASVRHAYRRWAPVYDFTFGLIAEAGRKHAVQIINRRKGRVLEVGVGTGLSLPCYGEPPHHHRHRSFARDAGQGARQGRRARSSAMSSRLHEMDAGALAFPDESFDTVVAMYVMTVVPDPERVMRELERVCAPGGEVILVNHFSQDEGFARLARAEARAVRRSASAGARCSSSTEVLVCDDLRLAERRSLRPLGLFTMLRFVKEPGFGLGPQVAREARLAGEGKDADARSRARLPEPDQGQDQMAGRARAGAWPAFA